MATDGNKRYLQYILLLGEGSKAVLEGILIREVNRKEKTLEQLLLDCKHSIEKRLHISTQRDHIFPNDTEVNTDLSTWDLSLLAKVILSLQPSSLSWNERAAVRIIKDMRDDIFAHAPSMSFESEDFDMHWTELSVTLRQLMSSLEIVIHEKCEERINRLETMYTGSEDVTNIVRESCQNDEELNNLADTLIRIIKSESKHLSDKIDEGFILVEEKMEKSRQETEAVVRNVNEETREYIKTQASDLKEHIDEKTEDIERSIDGAVASTSEVLNVLEDNVSQTTSALHDLRGNIHEHFKALSEQVAVNTEQSARTSAYVQETKDEMQVMKDVLRNLCEQMKTMQTQGKEFTTPQEFHIKLDIKATSRETEDLVEDQLIETFENVMKKVKRARLAGDVQQNEKLVKIVQQFKDDLETIDGVEIQDVKKECILLVIICSSLESMLESIKYSLSEQFSEHFRKMSRVLTDQHDQLIEIKVHVRNCSIRKVLRYMESTQRKKKTLRLSVRVHSLSGLKEMCKTFMEGTMEDRVREMSECLSEQHQTKINIQSGVDTSQIQSILRVNDTTLIRELPSTSAQNEDAKEVVSAIKVLRTKTMNVRLPDDRSVCSIYRLCSTADEFTLMADYSNSKLKRMNPAYEIVDYCSLPGKPWGVCLVNDTEIAVALNNNCVQFMNLRNQLELTKLVRFTHPCWSLSCDGERLFIKGGDSVYSYNTSGLDKRTLYTEPTEHAVYQNIAISSDGKSLYVLKDDNGFVAIDLNGRIVGCYEDVTKRRLDDICVDGRGHVFVCDKTSNVITMIDEKSLTKIKDLTDTTNTVREPWVLCYHRNHSVLVIGHLRRDTLTLLELSN
ncbi:hypothetical protein ACF0H5_023244 [Mactra antiquata]